MITISSTRPGAPQQIRVDGDLDLPQGDDLERRVRPLLVPGAKVAIDLRDVPFADSSGIGALLVLNQLAQDEGAELVLLDPSPVVRSVLQLTATIDLFTIAGPTAISHRRAS
jgi:anti-sigma B factor antagonist